MIRTSVIASEAKQSRKNGLPRRPDGLLAMTKNIVMPAQENLFEAGIRLFLLPCQTPACAGVTGG